MFPAPAYGGPPPKGEPPTEFSVMLVNAGDNKIEVIKVLRSLLNSPLSEAKHFAENTPRYLAQDISRAAAEELRDTLIKAGATVTFEPRAT